MNGAHTIYANHYHQSHKLRDQQYQLVTDFYSDLDRVEGILAEVSDVHNKISRIGANITKTLIMLDEGGGEGIERREAEMGERVQLRVALPNINTNTVVFSVYRHPDTGYLSFHEDCKTNNDITRENQSSLDGVSYYYDFESILGSIDRVYEDFLFHTDFNLPSDDVFIEPLNPEKDRFVEQSKRLFKKHLFSNLKTFIAQLDQDVVKTMNVAQFSGRVFYNWLLGCPNAMQKGANYASKSNEKLAKSRQEFVRNHPELGYVMGLILSHGKPTQINNSQTSTTIRAANANIFGFEHSVRGTNIKIEPYFVAQELFRTDISAAVATALVRSPSFWRNAQEDFWAMYEEFLEMGDQPQSFMHEVARSLENESRIKMSPARVPMIGGLQL